MEDSSPKSVVGCDFEAELKEEEDLEVDQAAWQQSVHTD